MPWFVWHLGLLQCYCVWGEAAARVSSWSRHLVTFGNVPNCHTISSAQVWSAWCDHIYCLSWLTCHRAKYQSVCTITSLSFLNEIIRKSYRQAVLGGSEFEGLGCAAAFNESVFVSIVLGAACITIVVCFTNVVCAVGNGIQEKRRPPIGTEWVIDVTVNVIVISKMIYFHLCLVLL